MDSKSNDEGGLDSEMEAEGQGIIDVAKREGGLEVLVVSMGTIEMDA